MTVIELIERSSARLDQAGVSFGHGTDNAFDEAAWLVLWRLGLPLDNLEGVADRALDRAQCDAVDALIAQRIESRHPAAYLTGEAWLQGVPFDADRRAIVPRSFIAELLADGSLDPWLAAHTEAVLDLCTGNGSLAVLAALAYPQVQVLGTDIDADALALARRNVARHDLASRITLRLSDGWQQIPERFDLVLCNPPYVPDAAMCALPPEYQAEPALALAGGASGMDFIGPMLQAAADHLNEHGVLVLEVGHERAAFEQCFPRLEAVWLPTSAGQDQVLLLTREALGG